MGGPLRADPGVSAPSALRFSSNVGLTVSYGRKVFSEKWEMEPVAATGGHGGGQKKRKQPSPPADRAVSVGSLCPLGSVPHLKPTTVTSKVKLDDWPVVDLEPIPRAGSSGWTGRQGLLP